jgi:hypothetical protein
MHEPAYYTLPSAVHQKYSKSLDLVRNVTNDLRPYFTVVAYTLYESVVEMAYRAADVS